VAVLNPDHLLDQARQLTTLAGPGAPRQADLRRAISGAYYALFHAILTQTADVLVGRKNRDSPRYKLVYRSVPHAAIRAVCENIIKPQLPIRYVPYEPRGGFGPDLVAVATAFIELYEKRHLADYDPLYHVTRSDAELATGTSATALDLFRNANPVARNVFLYLAVFSPR